MQADSAIHPRLGGRFVIDVLLGPEGTSTLAADVRRGLAARPKSLPPKHLYDDVGSRLFDRICDTPEYYPTRTEQALLEQIADELIARVAPTDIVELGSGAARKTRTMLDAAQRAGRRVRYVPFDVSESMLVASAEQLLDAYPWLEIHGVVGDYDHHIDRIPAGKRRLLLFIGGTIGNFEHAHAVRFLKTIREQMEPDDRLLLGTDLVKPTSVLEAAYNDAAGVTEAFNKNVLRVINRELGADFEVDAFEHVAFFETAKSQVEMHLRALKEQRVTIRDLDLTVPFAAGETIHTEISRKFTRRTISETLREAGLDLVDWKTSPNDYFGLSLSRRLG
jgi:L-histidine N-alpha-methyltransferase